MKRDIAKKTLSAQTLIEYAVFTVLIVVALLASQVYIKRAIQGRWKEAADQIGEQYDYHSTVADVTLTTESNTISNTTVVENPTTGKAWLQRKDEINAVETKTGTEMMVGE